MVKKYFFFFCLLFCICNLQAQKDSLAIKLNEIVLAISKVKDFSKGYHSIVVSDSLIGRNVNSLTDVLKFNSFIYFKENGVGMVSSPSFRGTNASQTAVIWNGININSQLNGQTDFNTISVNSYDNIIVRSGGGSVLFGSGAIGGSVHLNNSIQFLQQKKQRVLLKYGSFNTAHLSYNYKQSNFKNALNVALSYNTSDNDFKYLQSKLKNDNGSFSNFNVDVSYGYKISDKNLIKIFSNTYFSDRNLSRTLNAPSNDSYIDLSLKNLIEWSYFISKKEVITSKLGYVLDEFKFFDNNKNKDIFSVGTSKRKIVKVDYNNYISNKIQLNAILGFESTKATGSSFSSNKRDNFSGIVSLNQHLTKTLSYGFQIRKDIFKEFNSPFLYSLGIEQKFNKNYTLSFNTSKNFRVPTFNDLFWQPGGNENLKPEKSYQFEIGNTIRFNKFNFKINGFYIKSSDLIQWLPSQNSFWSPININKTRNLGLEFSANYKTHFNHHFFEINTNYSFTGAKNLESKEQLIYVPKNRGNLLFNYNNRNFSFYYQALINDEVSFFVDTIPAYTVSNIGVDFKLINIKNKPNIGLKVNNIYNSYYQSTLNRPMPGINFLITTNLNF